MLQRAANNANSWLWASNIRNKQTKWLDIDLQEMEGRVKSMIKIVEGDGDSFARKAEMYFKKRPELVHFVEETHKAYKSLADKYDHLSSELQKANQTIATAFPDQIPFDMQDADDDCLLKAITSIDINKIDKPSADGPNTDQIKENQPSPKKSRLARSGSKISKEKAQEEIDKLQKEVLVLQTEKEYIRSSYESGIEKCSDMEKQIAELQEEILLLQHEFNANVVIDEDEARNLMAATAVKSCEDSVVKLQKQRKQSMEEVKIEFEKIKTAKEKINSGKGESDKFEEIIDMHNESNAPKKHTEIHSDSSVAELTEKINELVTRVIDLELTATSQSAQIKSVRLEADIIHRRLQSFEEEKLQDKRIMVDEHSTVYRQSLNDFLIKETLDPDQDDKLKFDTTLEEVSKESMPPKIGDRVNLAQPTLEDVIFFQNEGALTHSRNGEVKKITETMKKVEESYIKDGHIFDHSEAQLDDNIQPIKESKPLLKGQEISPNKFQSSENGLHGGENIIMAEDQSVLCSYEDTRKRLSEVEKTNQDYILEMERQIRELKNANAIKDGEIHILRQNMRSLHQNSNDKKPESSENRNLEAIWEVENKGVDTSAIEEKFRREVDTLVKGTFEFWSRFRTSSNNMKKFQTTFEELRAEIEKIDQADSEYLPIDKKLREVKTELQVWLEQNMLLQGELKSKSSSLSTIQEDISRALQSNLEAGKVKFTRYQAAKFQGELLDMQLENSKVANELKTSLVLVTGLQADVEKAISRLHEKFELPKSQSINHDKSRHSATKNLIPLSVFLFSDKLKKKKQSIFTRVNSAPHKSRLEHLKI